MIRQHINNESNRHLFLSERVSYATTGTKDCLCFTLGNEKAFISLKEHTLKKCLSLTDQSQFLQHYSILLKKKKKKEKQNLKGYKLTLLFSIFALLMQHYLGITKPFNIFTSWQAEQLKKSNFPSSYYIKSNVNLWEKNYPPSPQIQPPPPSPTNHFPKPKNFQDFITL